MIRVVTDDIKNTILEMRSRGSGYGTIAKATGISRSRVASLITTNFESKCKYVCNNCGKPTNSERKLCNAEECRKAYCAEWQRDNRNRIIYGLSDDDYTTMLAVQDNKCILCDKSLTDTNSRVDHDHDTGRVRGILCHQCNIGIGILMENPALLRKAADYIEGKE